MTTGRAEICSHRETRVRAMSTSLTSTRSSRTAQSAGSSLSKPWVGAPLPPDVTVPVWCRGESENRRPVNAEKAAPMVYHPRASRPARAFGEPEPPDPSSRARARSARVAAPVAAGFKAGAAQRPSTVDPARSRVSSATRPATAAAAGDGSPGPQLFITSVGRATPRTTSARRGVSVAAADASRRHLAATRTCATSASTAAAARNHPHATLFDALRDHSALRAPSGGPSWTRVWRWPSASASARSARKRRRTNLGRRWRSRRTRSTARRRRGTRRRRRGARADRAEGESASLRARVAELETALRAKDAGHEAHRG